MADDDEGRTTKGRSRPKRSNWWKPGEALPWAKFWWADWLHDPYKRAMTPDQRGRFMDVRAATHGTRTPGVMTEEQVRCWAGYSPAEWRANREAFLPLFNVTRTKGKWRLEDVIETWRASLRIAKTNHVRAVKAAGVRSQNAAGRNGITPTSSAPSNRQAQLGADQMLEVESQPFGLKEVERPSVPDGETRSAQAGIDGHSPVDSGGTVAVSDLLGRALRAGSADGTGGTDPRSKGAE